MVINFSPLLFFFINFTKNLKIMYGIPVIKRCFTLEIKITSAAVGAQFPFPDNNILRQAGVRVYAIDAFTSEQQTTSSIGGNVVSLADSKYLSVTCLDSRNINVANQIPYFNLVSAYNNGVIREFAPFILVTQKSYIQVNSASFTANTTAILNIIYDINGK
jgi:hypothetical protein